MRKNSLAKSILVTGILALVGLGASQSSAAEFCADILGTKELKAGRSFYFATEAALIAGTPKELDSANGKKLSPKQQDFAYWTTTNLNVSEMLVAEPNFANGLRAVEILARNNAHEVVAKATKYEMHVSGNLQSGMLYYLRLFDPKSEHVPQAMAAFHMAMEYKPDTSYVNSNGWGFWLFGVNALDRAKATGNVDLENSAMRILNDERLVDTRRRGITRDTNHSLLAEMQMQFAQMMLIFKKTPTEIMEIRDNLLASLTRLGVKNEQMSEEYLMGLVSLHLEMGVSIESLASDFQVMSKATEKSYFSRSEKLAILRMVKVRKVSLAYAIRMLNEVDKNRLQISIDVKPPGKSRGGHQFLLSSKTADLILAAALTFTKMTPRQVVEFSQGVLRASAKGVTDYGASFRAEAVIARMILEKTNYSEQSRYVIMQAMTGHLTSSSGE